MKTSTKSQNAANIKTAGRVSDKDRAIILARGRLADARRWFERRLWKVLPQDERGMRILKWGADQAYLACPTNPKQSVRRWCRKWAPWLTAAELSQIIADTAVSNKRWSNDQCAAVLEISVRVSKHFRLRFIGANDDPDHKIRDSIRRGMAAERSRKYRATRSTGGKGGRPKSEGPKQWEQLGISRATYYRMRETKTPSRYISNNRKRDAVSVSHPKKSKTDIGVSAPALSGSQTNDSIGPVSDTPTDYQSLAGGPIKPDGLITHADFDEEPNNPKTRVRSTYWPTRRQREIAAKHGISLDSRPHLFSAFVSSHMAKGSYAHDWDVMWDRYVAKSIILDEEQQRRERAIAYFARKDGAASDADRSCIDWRL